MKELLRFTATGQNGPLIFLPPKFEFVFYEEKLEMYKKGKLERTINYEDIKEVVVIKNWQNNVIINCKPIGVNIYKVSDEICNKIKEITSNTTNKTNTINETNNNIVSNNAESVSIQMNVKTNNILLPQEALIQVRNKYVSEINNPNMETILEFLPCLIDSRLYVPMNVSISNNDFNNLANVKEGDVISLNNNVIATPDLLKNGNDLFYPIFSNLEEIPNNYKEKFSWIEKPIDDCLNFLKKNTECTGLVLDAFSKPVVIADKLLGALNNLLDNTRKLEKSFIDNEFNEKVMDNNKFIRITTNSQNHQFSYATNTKYTVPNTNITFAIATDKNNRTYLFINKDFNPYHNEEVASPLRVVYPGLVTEPFKRVYLLDNTLKIETEEREIIIISII